MTSSRLQTALEDGLLDWPDGTVCAFRADAALPGLPLDRLTVVHGFRPEVRRWADAGITTLTAPEGRFAACYVAVPRARRFAMRLVRDAVGVAEPGALVLVDGQKTDGIDSLLRQCRKVFDIGGSIAKAHGKLFWFRRPDTLPEDVADWGREAARADGWATSIAGFSADGPDAGSMLLVDNLPDGLSGHVLDLGAGWGFLSAAVLARPAVRQVDLLEAEHDSLAAARRNIDDPRARFLWEDALTFHPDAEYDAVVCNPPFHAGRAANPDIGRGFLQTAARALHRNGQLALVANRHLPYERSLGELFARTRTVVEANGFKVIHAENPKKRAHRP